MKKNYKIINDDCFNYLPKIKDQSIDLIILDPPYGTTQNSWDSIIDLEKMWKEILRVIKDNGAIVIFGAEPFSSRLRMSCLQFFRYDIIWEKTLPVGFLNAKKMPLRSHETISVFYKKLPTYNPQKTYGHKRKTATRINKSTNYGKADKKISYDSTERMPRSVIKFSQDKQKKALHPTQKPVGLLRYLIRTFSNEKETVLDFCGGVFSTGVAALLENRKFIGVELHSPYFKLGEHRLEQYKEEDSSPEDTLPII
jgi:site-specific DNA-methyltransferase (adenine-specific)